MACATSSRGTLGGQLERSSVLALLNQLRILPPAMVLEAGCGWGTNLEALEAAGYRITGLDISRKMLEQLDRDDRQLVQADLSQGLPNCVPTYDCVLALDVIEHLDDDRHSVQQLGRLLSRQHTPFGGALETPRHCRWPTPIARATA